MYMQIWTFNDSFPILDCLWFSRCNMWSHLQWTRNNILDVCFVLEIVHLIKTYFVKLQWPRMSIPHTQLYVEVNIPFFLENMQIIILDDFLILIFSHILMRVRILFFFFFDSTRPYLMRIMNNDIIILSIWYFFRSVLPNMREIITKSIRVKSYLPGDNTA